MTYETRDNSGALFKEEDRQNENSPHYAGTVKVAGKDYRIAAWLKEGKSGRKFMSLSFTPMDGKGQQKPAPRTQQRDDGYDMPF